MDPILAQRRGSGLCLICPVRVSLFKVCLNTQVGRISTINQTQRQWNNAFLMLGHRLRRWPNIKTALCHCLAFAENVHSAEVYTTESSMDSHFRNRGMHTLPMTHSRTSYDHQTYDRR